MFLFSSSERSIAARFASGKWTRAHDTCQVLIGNGDLVTDATMEVETIYRAKTTAIYTRTHWNRRQFELIAKSEIGEKWKHYKIAIFVLFVSNLCS
jgi:hypothetical protein